MNWKRIAQRRFPGRSIMGDGKYAALDGFGNVRLYSTRLQLVTCAPTGSTQIELSEESAAPRPRDIRNFEIDPA